MPSEDIYDWKCIMMRYGTSIVRLDKLEEHNINTKSMHHVEGVTADVGLI